MVIAAFFRNESCGQCVPCRVGTVRQQEALARLLSGRTRGTVAGRARADRRDRRGDARRLDLRPGADRPRRRSSRPSASWECSHDASAWSASRSTTSPVEVPEGSTIMRRPARSSASTRRRSATARRCSPPTPAACAWSSSRGRACWRPPARARWSPGWSSRPTPSACATRRKMVHGVPRVVRRTCRRRRSPRATWSATTREPERYGPPAPPDPDRDNRRTGHHEEPDGQTAATVHSPIKVDNDLYVRDYSKCILCYKCVDACGDAVAEHVRHHRRRPRVRRADLDRVREPAAGLGVRVLRQLHRGLPHRRADVRLRARAARGRAVGRVAPDDGGHDLPVLRRRLQPHAARAGQRRSSRSPRPTTTTSRAATSASRAASASSTCGRSRAPSARLAVRLTPPTCW